ncbi:MAG: lipocalin-like domain-containing protein [Prevotellaceae bacterium]|nr:lipocalin-like domain-containing protein [Prevotellaceae bacterium]MCD8285360.1 lipocalin-like domain-containing protein [Prevotellaceae bacterium]MCD8304389.1 lipocalin-like domain-containing protein [Prevotellaceae bacterium]
MRHTLPKAALCLLAALASLASCDNKRDTNGDLGGMWQLTEWRDQRDSLVATNKQQIYYSFQLELMKIQRIGDGTYYLALFTHTQDSLIVLSIYNRPDEELVSLEDMREYGIPQDGRFHIDALSESHLVLSGQEGTLAFRKY